MILLLLGRSGCGKSTLEQLLISRHGYKKVSTCTTRDRREGESADAYHFMSREEFTERLSRDEFVEWDKYGNNFYGTLRTSLESDEMLVIAITPEGAANVKKAFPDAFIVNVCTDMKTSVMRAVSREKELNPGIMYRIYQRAIQDYVPYDNPVCDYIAENPDGTDLNDLADRIANEHLKYVFHTTIKETREVLKDGIQALEGKG